MSLGTRGIRRTCPARPQTPDRRRVQSRWGSGTAPGGGGVAGQPGRSTMSPRPSHTQTHAHTRMHVYSSHSPPGFGHLGAELGELSRRCPLRASLGGNMGGAGGLTLSLGAPAPSQATGSPVKEVGMNGGQSWVRAAESGYLAHKGHQLGTCRALTWAQPELRVVIRSHRELDVS